MNLNVAETGEVAPGERRVLRGQRRIQLLGDFADHFKAADDPVLQQFRLEKGSASGGCINVIANHFCCLATSALIHLYQYVMESEITRNYNGLCTTESTNMQ